MATSRERLLYRHPHFSSDDEWEPDISSDNESLRKDWRRYTPVVETQDTESNADLELPAISPQPIFTVHDDPKRSFIPSRPYQEDKRYSVFSSRVRGFRPTIRPELGAAHEPADVGSRKRTTVLESRDIASSQKKKPSWSKKYQVVTPEEDHDGQKTRPLRTRKLPVLLFGPGLERLLPLRALLDTGSDHNLITLSRAHDLGIKIDSNAPEVPLRVANGKVLYCRGSCKVTMYVPEHEDFGGFKPQEVKFLIAPDTLGIDCIIGWPFIKAERLFQWGDDYVPTLQEIFMMSKGKKDSKNDPEDYRKQAQAQASKSDTQAKQGGLAGLDPEINDAYQLIRSFIVPKMPDALEDIDGYTSAEEQFDRQNHQLVAEARANAEESLGEIEAQIERGIQECDELTRNRMESLSRR